MAYQLAHHPPSVVGHCSCERSVGVTFPGLSTVYILHHISDL